MLRTFLRVLLPIVAVPSVLFAQDSTMRHRDQTRIDTTRIGIMSPMVVQQRLKMLGYSQVTVVENVRLHASVNAVKAGRAVAVRYDPNSGKVTELPGRFVLRAIGLRLIKPDGAEVLPPPR
jgi:hypothetical protein